MKETKSKIPLVLPLEKTLGNTARKNSLRICDMNGIDFFDLWKTARCEDAHRKPMGKSGLQQAELIWRKWLHFCSEKQLDWKASLATDISEFGSGIHPRTSRAGRKVSPVTLRRYWRILSDIYAYAVLVRAIAENPATAAMPKKGERTPSLALTPNMWVKLQEGLPGGHTYKDRRNRLTLLLMMRCALSVNEIINLSVRNVEPHEGTPEEVSIRHALAGLPVLQPESPFYKALEPHPTYVLQLDGARDAQKRRLILDKRTSKAVHDWLEVRKLASGSRDGRLILGDSNGAGITGKGLYNICLAHIEKCLPQADQILHLGPNTLRNTCISIWYNQNVSGDEIRRRCGLKDAGVLTRLQNHLNPSVSL